MCAINIPCIVQGYIIFLFDMHIIGRECYAREMLGGLETMSFIHLFVFSPNLGNESLLIS